MTKTQKDDRAFWRYAAEQAHAMAHGEVVPGGFLCVEIMRVDRDSTNRRRAQLDLFASNDAPAHGGGYWAMENTTTPTKDAPATGRVLAACFLAAMAESGDL